MVKKKIKEALTQTEKGKDGLTSSNLQLNDSLNDQQLTNPAVKKSSPRSSHSFYRASAARIHLTFPITCLVRYQSNGSAQFVVSSVNGEK
ncbi:unnamed protein product, partial [Mesorhabditis belari]|uniref:Uncharacterized protein n=1 Tax=Mesorhabditis belari TaxID=2138241 RepID=A0AAF3FPD4_9BILA